MEGNIGSGKTSLIEYFARKYPRRVFPLLEPVEKWRDVEGHNLFALYYKDPQKWSLAFQQYVQLTMTQLHAQPLDDSLSDAFSGCPVKLMERSIYSARHCFVENLRKSGLLSEPEFVVYDKWYSWLTSRNDLKVDLTVYITSSPEICHERIKKRCRTEEASIPKVIT